MTSEPRAVQTLVERLDDTSRVLLLGAGGWFGSTFLDLVGRSGSKTAVMPVTARPRDLVLGGQKWSLNGWDSERVSTFAPTLVVNCAFLTRNRIADLGYDAYVAENVRLMGRFSNVLALPSVRAAVTVSSGAAVFPDPVVPDAELNPYGYLKRVEESAAAALAAALGKAFVVCRAWSVSGPFVNRPEDYAFSNLVLQSASGRFEIQSPHEVWRRYVGVDDLLAVCVALALDGWSGTVDSGGPLFEIADLARCVARELCPDGTIDRPQPDGSPPDRYHSDDSSWQTACERLGHQPAGIEEQIRLVAERLLAGRR